MYDVLPLFLKKQKYWCVFRLAKRKNSDRLLKIPYGPLTKRPLDTKKTEGWVDFDTAIASASDYDGIGVRIVRGLVAIDIDDRTSHPLLEKVETYAELSPSGKGIRMFLRGKLDGESFDPAVSIYSGQSAHYVTVTGNRIKGERIASVKPYAAMLQKLCDQKPETERPPVPEPKTVEISDPERGILNRGFTGDDRSTELRARAIELAKFRSPEDVFHMLATEGTITWDLALSKRRRTQKAREFLWWHTCKNLEQYFIPLADDDVGFATYEEMMKKLKPIDWSVRGIIESGTVGVVFGKFASFKSALMVDLALSAASDRPFLDEYECSNSTVFYGAGEGLSGYPRRIKAWEMERNARPTESERLLFHRVRPDLATKESMTELSRRLDRAEQMTGRPVDFLIFDTLAKTTAGLDENVAKDINTLWGHVYDILYRAYRTIIFVHHVGHTSQERARGSSAIPDGCDWQIGIQRLEGDRASLTSVKQKNARPFDKITVSAKEIHFKVGDELDSSFVLNVVGADEGEIKPMSDRASSVLSEVEARIALEIAAPIVEVAKAVGLTDRQVRGLVRSGRPLGEKLRVDKGHLILKGPESS